MKFCQIHNKYEWIKCKNPVLEADSEGMCLLHSKMPNKDNKLFIENIKTKLINEDYDFAGSFFPCEIHFSGLTFKKAVDFRNVIFSGPSNFINVNFNDEARFDSSVFLKTADFNRATFSGIANFSNAQFKSEIYFVAATFKELGYFDRAIFYAEGNFALSVFYSQVSFSTITVFGKVCFQAINLPKKDGSHDDFRADFGFININADGLIIFQDLSLAKVEFFGTDMRLVELRNVVWHNLFGRQAVFDEILVNERELNYFKRILRSIRKKAAGPDKGQYSRIEILYRYLKLNFEKVGDLKQAGDFHYGEMEMHRRASKWRWFPLYWYNLYRVLNGYGERPSWALGWLAGFLLALPVLVWEFGLDSVAGETRPGFLETLAYIFEKATFQRPLLLSNLNLLGRFISNLSLLIIPGQAALFLLALRNRLGRRR